MKKSINDTNNKVTLLPELLPFVNSDRELVLLFDNFVNNDVANINTLDNKTRYMAILSVLIGSQAVDTYKHILLQALDGAITPQEVKEIVYQSVAYVGYGRGYPFVQATNEVLSKCGVSMPLEGQCTTNCNTRHNAGEKAQIAIFGESMRGFSQSGEQQTRHINRWLTDNCFGDYYTRNGLDLRQRELVTFCLLYAQGGCEAQLASHIVGNINIGNDKSLLIQVVSQCLPYIGYPRSLNAISCIKQATAQ